MKIAKKKGKETAFQHLEAGDVFLFREIHCIKTDKHDAINLENGETVCFGPLELVEFCPNAEFTP